MGTPDLGYPRMVQNQVVRDLASRDGLGFVDLAKRITNVTEMQPAQKFGRPAPRVRQGKR